MNENGSSRPSVGDEIDLRTVFDKIGRFFKRIVEFTVTSISLSTRSWKFMLPFILAGIGIGFLGYKTTKPYYNSSMVMMLSNIRNDFVKNHLYNLSVLAEEDNFEALSKSLNIDLEEAKQIKGLTFANIDEEMIEEDSVLTGSPFRVDLKLYDNSLYPMMEEAITTYLENNPYFSRNKFIRQRQLESMLAKLKEDITSIDSIKTVVVNPRGSSNGFIYGEATDPTNLYKEAVSMFERRTFLEAELQRIDNIQVVVGFTTRIKPASLSLKKFLFFGALLGYVVGLILLLSRETTREKLNTDTGTVYF